ncbi:MAG: NADH-quinone oxidoreductase subunit L [Pseudomonadota bacterium]
MLRLLWLVPALPLLGYLVLVLAGGRLTRRGIQLVGVGAVGLAALIALLIAVDFLNAPPPEHAYTQVLWTWMALGELAPRIAFHLDPLALVMMGVITGVGFLIHIYSTEYMADDPGHARFFAYMNLFVAAMLVLVLADNLLLLYLGWEGVGLCSYLLIGFWYQDPANGLAARKAFVVTRVGDVAFIIGLFLLFTQLGTLDIQALLERAAQQWPAGSGLAVAAALLLLGGAVGKSAQLPLQTWLPDAMAGPTPVSALIHAATMVTAGVYLIARTHVLFTLAPDVQFLVAVIGAATLLLAGLTALTHWDIKRILAYSTMSQIGYMFLALGVGAWSAAIFHLITHAFFKALLFMGAGAVILSLHHEQDIRRMGGLRQRLPLVFWTFLIGSAALAALPLVTAGFYSKDLILTAAWAAPRAGPWLWAAGWLGAFITGVYIFRLVFIAFFGEARGTLGHSPGPAMRIPLVLLAILSLVGGFVELPPTLGDRPLLSDFLRPALPAVAGHVGQGLELTLQLLSGAAALAGIGLAYLLFLRRPQRAAVLAARPGLRTLWRFWRGGWGFDWLYDRLLVHPFLWLARVNRRDLIDWLYDGAAQSSRVAHWALSRSQAGLLRWYAAGIAVGAVLVILLAVLP